MMIIGSVLLATLLVSVSLYLYNTSGAAQLDLSRPGYVDIRSKTVDSSSEFKNYATTGPITQASIDEFKTLYDEQADKIKLASAFKGDPLNLDALGVNSSNSQ
jgi:hypothetical protein